MPAHYSSHIFLSMKIQKKLFKYLKGYSYVPGRRNNLSPPGCLTFDLAVCPLPFKSLSIQCFKLFAKAQCHDVVMQLQYLRVESPPLYWASVLIPFLVARHGPERLNS